MFNERKILQILGFFVMVPLVIVLMALDIIRKKEDMNEVLNQRLNTAETELNKIRSENNDLNRRLENLNYK